MSYRTFKRSCTNWEQFSSADKITDETGLTYSEARERCQDFNDNRSAEEIESGTKLEFEEE